jgi:hypothetical protein
MQCNAVQGQAIRSETNRISSSSTLAALTTERAKFRGTTTEARSQQQTLSKQHRWWIGVRRG